MSLHCAQPFIQFHFICIALFTIQDCHKAAWQWALARKNSLTGGNLEQDQASEGDLTVGGCWAQAPQAGFVACATYCFCLQSCCRKNHRFCWNWSTCSTECKLVCCTPTSSGVCFCTTPCWHPAVDYLGTCSSNFSPFIALIKKS